MKPIHRHILQLLVGVMAAVTLVSTAVAETYRDRNVAITSVTDLDINSYLGVWYEIARFSNRFERGCEGVTAEYAPREDGKISVTNTCREGSTDGPARKAEGVARVDAPGQLSVSFVRWLPFARGDYWVLYVDPDYSLAVVGTPRGKTGWILARSPRISDEDRATAESVLARNGYDVSKLRDVAHGR